MQVHIVHASENKKYFVEAKDSSEAIRILIGAGIDTRGAIADPYQHEVQRGTKVYRFEDATAPLLGGTYTLKLKDITGRVEVATCKLGPLWSVMFEEAKKMYGAENVTYSFSLDPSVD